jgi:predicted dehydrogenase/threonine dehydrogenase-like Zn-dependent dehydrogenase
MRQILQSLKTGQIELADVPAPAVAPGSLLIRTRVSLISAGTERMLLDFGRASWLDKARQQPDKVRQVLDKVRTDGLWPTLTAVRNKLDQPLPLGYCNVGEVVAVGAGVTGFAVGDRVASNGQHAELVSVPAILCARIPDAVDDEAAAFTVAGAIALQGIRLAQPTLGEAFVVVGLGLIGLLTVQLLRAQGCRVLGMDLDPSKLALAPALGATVVDLPAGEDPVAAASRFSRGRGVDGVLLTLSTDSAEPVHQAAQMCRQRGRIVLVGVTGLELSRADFYEKELSFQVSCSYGPGRYDPAYEEKGQDYPFGFVRWTEQRNFEAVLDMVAEGRIQPLSLVSHRFALEACQQAYDLIGSRSPSLGVLLRYPQADSEVAPAAPVREITLAAATPQGATPVVALVGAGNYAGQVLAPALKQTGARLKSVTSAGGVSSLHVGRKNGFEHAGTDLQAVWSDAQVDAVVIATRHNAHARQVCAALQAGKHVFVEKPLALTLDELAQIEAAYRQAALQGRVLTVGFNRRFAPQVQRMRSLLAAMPQPKAFVVTVNAGFIPAGHWTQDPAQGGGRIVGEACHFIDLLRHLVGHPVERVLTATLGGGAAGVPADSVSFTLCFADGSTGTVHYLANGSKAFPKERIEVFCGGRILQIDNFRRMRGWGWPGFKRMNLWRQDKGTQACVQAFVDSVRQGREAPIAWEELAEVARVSIEVAEAARS